MDSSLGMVYSNLLFLRLWLILPPNNCIYISKKVMKFKGLVFDFDGTLANLTIDFEKIKRKILLLAEIFFEYKVEGLEGYPLLECIEELTNRLKMRDIDLSKEFNTRCRLILVDMEMRAARRGSLFAYTKQVLMDLKQSGIKLGIITRNCTPAIKMVFPDLDDYVDILLTREDVPRVKPDPVHVSEAIKEMGVESKQVLVVGDHPIDILCAKKAGVKSGAVVSGNSSFEELMASNPDFIESDIKTLYYALKEQDLI